MENKIKKNFPLIFTVKDGEFWWKKNLNEKDMSAIAQFQTDVVTKQIQKFLEDEIYEGYQLDIVGIAMAKALMKTIDDIWEHDQNVGDALKQAIKMQIMQDW